MTIQMVMGDKVQRVYVGWRWFLYWPDATTAAKRNAAHGRVTILRGFLKLEEW